MASVGAVVLAIVALAILPGPAGSTAVPRCTGEEVGDSTNLLAISRLQGSSAGNQSVAKGSSALAWVGYGTRDPNLAWVSWIHSFGATVSAQMRLPRVGYTSSGTHFAKGFTSNDTAVINEQGMKEDCDNINLNKKLRANFRPDVFGSGMKAFFYKCEQVGDRNKYWFTITSASESNMRKLCNPNSVYPIVYDAQHSTYWQDLPFACDHAPYGNLNADYFIGVLVNQMQLVPSICGAEGTHFAKFYTSDGAVDKKGMEEDCDNINLNKKLIVHFRPHVFGWGMKVFYHTCDKVGDSNKYSFTVVSVNRRSFLRFCSPYSAYPRVHDKQHSTHRQDLQFKCFHYENWRCMVF
ncbi:unnamed protein product [Polarella glacialis]|uniref:Uncharacterized protein n=1 Tax=Polarella glacialis TaxID=89957 RepID=A0A813I3P8_POLGL|nr:unnamed protein product [Polarella glacialis]